MLQQAAISPSDTPDRSHDSAALGLLFHRLNNQLGIVLAHAELLESQALDEHYRRRAGHVVTGVIDALTTARDIKIRLQASMAVTAPE